MKLFLSKYTCFLSFALLITPAIFCADSHAESASAPKPRMTLEFKSMAEFIDDFFDTNKKQEKILKWWACQCVMLILKDAEKDTKCSDTKKANRHNFLANIQLIAKSEGKYAVEKEREDGIKRTFLQGYTQQLFPQDAAALIISKLKGTVKDTTLKAIAARAAKVS